MTMAEMPSVSVKIMLSKDVYTQLILQASRTFDAILAAGTKDEDLQCATQRLGAVLCQIEDTVQEEYFVHPCTTISFDDSLSQLVLLWIVGEKLEDDPESVAWKIVSPHVDYEEALAHCTMPSHFVSCNQISMCMPGEGVDPRKGIFPISAPND